MDATILKQKVDEALRLSNQLASKYVNSLSFAQVVDQLNYLERIYQRDGNFKAVPPNQLTLGVLAAKEYETNDPPFAYLLFDINYAIKHPD